MVTFSSAAAVACILLVAGCGEARRGAAEGLPEAPLHPFSRTEGHKLKGSSQEEAKAQTKEIPRGPPKEESSDTPDEESEASPKYEPRALLKKVHLLTGKPAILDKEEEQLLPEKLKALHEGSARIRGEPVVDLVAASAAAAAPETLGIVVPAASNHNRTVEPARRGLLSCPHSCIQFAGNLLGISRLELPFYKVGEHDGMAIYQSSQDYLYYYDEGWTFNGLWIVGPHLNQNLGVAWNDYNDECPEDLPRYTRDSFISEPPRCFYSLG